MTKNKQIKPSLTLIQNISQMSDFNSALMVALGHVCETTDWNYGEVWVPEENHPDILKLVPVWSINADNPFQIYDLGQFRECSQAFILHLGEGLPGRVGASRQPEWIVDVSANSETYFLRNNIAKAFGVKAGLGLPIVIDDCLIAVVVFFMLEARTKDARLIEITKAAIAELELCLPKFLQ
jgi:hypothetical protein